MNIALETDFEEIQKTLTHLANLKQTQFLISHTFVFLCNRKTLFLKSPNSKSMIMNLAMKKKLLHYCDILFSKDALK